MNADQFEKAYGMKHWQGVAREATLELERRKGLVDRREPPPCECGAAMVRIEGHGWTCPDVSGLGQ